jgi:prophage regulatory protein
VPGGSVSLRACACPRKFGVSSTGAAPVPTPNDRHYLITWDILKPQVKYCRQHVGRLEDADKFPKRVQLGPGRVAWWQDEVDAWLESRVRGPAPKFAHLLDRKDRHPEPSPEDVAALRRMANALGFDLVMPEPERSEARSGP